MEPIILKEWPECPVCGSSETVSHMGTKSLRDRHLIAEDAFSRLRTQVTPLQSPKIAGVMAEAIAVHYDVCLGCGLERCTRAELVKVPVVGAGGMPQQPN